MSKLPRNTKYLVPKGGRFYFRIRIPDDLRAIFGKREHSEALGDLTKAQAEVRAGQLGAHWNAAFLTERHRLGLASHPPVALPVGPLLSSNALRPASIEEVQAVAARAAHELLLLDEAARIDGTQWQGADSSDFGPGLPLAEAVREVISGRSVAALRMQAEEQLSAVGLTLPADAAEQRRALYAWGQATAKATKGFQMRDAGEVVEMSASPPLPESVQEDQGKGYSPAEKPAHLLKLRDVLELWKGKAKRPSVKTVVTAERIVGQFEEVCGNPPLLKLTRQDGLKFRDWLLAQGQSPRTASDRLDYVSRLIRFEMAEQQRVTVNPWASIRIEDAREPVQQRKAIRPEKVAALFALPLFQAYALPSVRTAGRDAAYWIPLLGAYTGGRVTELAQLLVSDITRDGALWCISIMEDREWQSVKNRPSKRTIPMHPELVRLGLPEYADALSKQGHERLFPLAPVSQLNNAGGPFSTWFSKLKISIGWGPENTFHSFRHTIETMLKRKKKYPFDINAYTGHKQPGGDADNTYSHPEPADLLDVAEAVQHEGVDLPRVFPPPGWEPPAVQTVLLMTQPRAKKGAEAPAVKRPPGRPKKATAN